MNKKIYFAGSIRGGRSDENLYRDMIEYLKKTDIVLTEHIGNLTLSALEDGDNHDVQIYKQDTGWLQQCDLVIAEATTPSLGVGYEMAYAEKLGKPVHILYNQAVSRLSAMLTGDDYFKIYPYNNSEEVFAILDEILKQD